MIIEKGKIIWQIYEGDLIWTFKRFLLSVVVNRKEKGDFGFYIKEIDQNIKNIASPPFSVSLSSTGDKK